MPALPKRPGVEIFAERAIEVLIRLCGISAILFVFGIFFFVFREGLAASVSRLQFPRIFLQPGMVSHLASTMYATACWR